MAPYSTLEKSCTRHPTLPQRQEFQGVVQVVQASEECRADLTDLSYIYTCPLPLGLDLELDNCMPRPHQRYQSICRTSLIHLDVRIIKIEALPLAAKLHFHVSLPRGNTHAMSWTLGNVIHAPSDVIEQGLHQSKHVSGSAV